MKKLVSFLVPDIGAPTIGAALKLARMLEPGFRTEIVGPDFGRGVCSLYREAYPFRALPAGRLYRLPDYWWERRKLSNELKGDLIVALKGFATTVPVALRAKRKRGVPVAVYLDEWDAALWHGLPLREKTLDALRHIHHPAEACYLPGIERSIQAADTVISTTTWLQRRFGGHIVHAGVDCGFFCPQPSAKVADLKRELGLEGKKVIVFGGVVRPHKGLEEILEAILNLDRDDVRLLVVGPITDHLDQFMKSDRFGHLLVVAGDPVNAKTPRNAEIHKNMPLYLDVGDLVVLPLRDTLLAQSQMPIKIFEALAMAKPVIGTEVADLPLVLEGCGWIVPPDDSAALANAMAYAFDHPEEMAMKGNAARAKCVSEFSAEVCGAKLRGLVGEMV